MLNVDLIDEVIKIGNETAFAMARKVARLEGIAEPGGVTLIQETYTHVRDMVTARAMEPIAVKGIQRQVTPYRVTGLNKNAQADARIIRAGAEGFRLFADLEKLKGKPRKDAVKALTVALERLETKSARSDRAAE